MRVYAEYFEKDNIRKKTLLQFGDSINLIGSAVLTNPGSAAPIRNDFDKKPIFDFYRQTHNQEIHSLKSWYLFDNDPTMGWLEKIFNGWYINENNKNIELNGIIQLFNCFYNMNQNRKYAIEQFIYDPKIIFSEAEYFLKEPVYFGWGKLQGNIVLKKKKKNIFLGYNCEYTPIYNEGFENNNFYHPKYINCSFKKDGNVRELLKSFHKLINK